MRLKELREKNGITQKELASQLNLKQSAISAYELEKIEPSIDLLKKFASFFNVSIDYIVELKNNTLDIGIFSQEQLDLINIIKMMDDGTCKRLKDIILGLQANTQNSYNVNNSINNNINSKINIKN